jgi:hypothetical protein
MTVRLDVYLLRDVQKASEPEENGEDRIRKIV